MILTFDCYGTLIDWESGIADACRAAAASDGIALDGETAVAIHATVEPLVQSSTFRTYREVQRDVAVGVAARVGWTLDPNHAGFLADSIPRWQPFDDTNGALEALEEQGHTLGILSNIDDDLLAATVTHFPVNFDFLVTAQQLQSYKPALRHFERAREIARGEPWMHVAQSYFHDVEPAVAFGVPVVWINRKGELPSGAARAIAEFSTLAEFVDALGAGSISVIPT